MKIDINELNLNLWIVRNKNKNLYLFYDRPFKELHEGNEIMWCSNNYCGDYCANYYGISLQFLLIICPDGEKYFDFSLVHWEDNQPKQLKDILRYFKKRKNV